MAARAAPAVPRQSAPGDKEVNVQVLLRCRCGARGSGAARRACRPAEPVDAAKPADARRRQCRTRRPQNAEEIKQRVPQVIKCNDALREVRRCGYTQLAWLWV